MTEKTAAFSVTNHESGAATRLVLHGELDFSTAPELRAAFDEALERNPRLVEVDLGDLSFIDVGGAKVIAHARSQLADKCEFVIRNPSRLASMIFALFGVEDCVHIGNEESSGCADEE